MRTQHLILIFFFVLGLSSCESLLQIETPNALNNIVVESDLSTQLTHWEVKITESQAYYNQDSVKGVESALVIISDNLGNKDTLIHQSKGIYHSLSVKNCVPGNTILYRQ